MKWEDPPARTRVAVRGRVYGKEADELRANPGQWGLVDVFTGNRMINAPGTASGMRRGQYAAFKPAGAFEAVSRKVVEQGVEMVKIYARYVGSTPGLR